MATNLLLLLVASTLRLGEGGSVIHLRTGKINTDEIDPIQEMEVGLQDEHSRLYLVNFKETTEEGKGAVSGILHEHLEEYIPDNTFVVFADHSQIFKIKALPHVAWVGEFKREYKVSPMLKKDASKLNVILAHDTHRDSTAAHKVAKRMSDRCDVHAKSATANLMVVDVKVSQDTLKVASCCAEIEEVLWVEERVAMKFHMPHGVKR
ncbi:hypothetical protein AAMO2058_001624200 [Amorphochlora amoebiformis]